MQKIHTTHGEKTGRGAGGASIPAPELFRPWLRESLTRLELAPSSYGMTLGLSKNSLGYFLSGDGRDLRLGTASMLVADLSRRAAAGNTSLPPLPFALEGCANE